MGPYRFMTFREVEETVAAVASAYVKLGIKPHDRIGVLGANCKEWMISMQVGARMCCGAMTSGVGRCKLGREAQGVGCWGMEK